MAIVSSAADTATGPVSTGPVVRVGGNPFRFITSLRPGDIIAIAPFILFALLFLLIPTLGLVVGAFQDPAGNFTLQNIIDLGTPQIVASFWISIRVSAAGLPAKLSRHASRL